MQLLPAVLSVYISNKFVNSYFPILLSDITFTSEECSSRLFCFNEKIEHYRERGERQEGGDWRETVVPVHYQQDAGNDSCSNRSCQEKLKK